MRTHKHADARVTARTVQCLLKRYVWCAPCSTVCCPSFLVALPPYALGYRRVLAARCVLLLNERRCLPPRLSEALADVPVILRSGFCAGNKRAYVLTTDPFKASSAVLDTLEFDGKTGTTTHSDGFPLVTLTLRTLFVVDVDDLEREVDTAWPSVSEEETFGKVCAVSPWCTGGAMSKIWRFRWDIQLHRKWRQQSPFGHCLPTYFTLSLPLA